MPLNYKKLGKGSVQRKQVASTNIYEGMVTRNVSEHTYTTAVDGTGVAVHPQARTRHGGGLITPATPTFAARQPKGMLLRTSEGPKQVHMTPKS